MNASFFRRYAEFIIRYRVSVILIILGLTLFLGSHLTSLKIDMDPDIWAPQAHPYVKATKQLENVFGGRNITVIGIVPKEGDIYQPDILAKVQRIQQGIELIPEAIRHNILSFSAHKVKEIKGTPEGMEVRPLMETIPQTAAEMERLKKAVASNPLYINALVSPDGKAVSIIADFKVSKENPSYAALYQSIRKVVDKERDDRVNIYMGGLPVGLAWFEFHMFKMPIYFGVALLIIMGIQYWSFRSLQGMLLPILTALLSVIWGLGFMGVLGVHMDGMNTTTPILIMAVAAGHAVQILKRYYEEYYKLQAANTLTPREASKKAVIESLVRVGPVMLTAGLIAVITFYSLTMSGISVVQHFGVFAGSGVLGALILEMTFIPVLRSLLPPAKCRDLKRERTADILDRSLLSLANNLIGGKASLILGAGVLLIGLAFIGITRIRADNSIKMYNTAKSEVRMDDAALNERFGGTESIFFLIEGREQDSIKDPKVLRGMAALQKFLDGQPHVGKTQSLADLMKRMNQAMHGDDSAFNTVPESRDLIAQYLLLYSLSGDPQDFDSFVDNDYRQSAVWVYLKDDSTVNAEAIYQKAKTVIAENFPPGITVSIGGSLPQTIAINEVLTNGKFRNMAQMALVVFLLSSLVFRSFVGGLFVVIPLLMIILANFGLMGLLGVPLDMGTATTAAMAIGIGADYELYLLFRFREELTRSKDLLAATRDSLLSSGKAIIFVALSIAGGYAILLSSGFAFYTRLSMMVMSTMVVSALSALLFLRAMMILFKPRFVFGNLREEVFGRPPAMEGEIK